MALRRNYTVLRLNLAALAAVAALLMLANSASAAWPAGASLVSGSSELGIQGTIASADTTVSANGKYAVFRSSASDLLAANAAPYGGIFRKNLTDDSAPLQLVVPNPSTNTQCGPKLPSISGDGRYVAFSSGVDGLVASDTNGRQDVFVRDMNTPIGSTGDFDLVSAVDGGDAGASYSIPPIGGIGAAFECALGAKLTQNIGNAISNDGSKVIFTNNAYTDLDSPTVGNGTAPGQLWVRDRSVNETTLHTVVSEEIDSPDPTLEVGQIGEPLADPEPFNSWDDAGEYLSVEPRATISGDGSTIGWSGVWARSLVTYQAAEAWESLAVGGPYSTTRKLLWKRISGVPSGAIRMVTGLADPDDPACDQDADWVDLISDEEPANAVEAGCRGPLRADEGEQCNELEAPQLSYDGLKVFFTTCAELRGDPLTNLPEQDVMVTSMAPGVSRKAGTKQLTYAINQSTTGQPRIQNFSASDDGNRVALVTQRSDFSGVSSISFTGTAPPVGVQRSRMFLIDGGCDAEVHNGTVEWIARPASGDLTAEGVPAGISTGVVGLDADGSTVGFASGATNLFVGHNGQTQALSVADSSAGCADTLDPTVKILSPDGGDDTTDATIPVRYLVSDDSGEATCDIVDGSSQPLQIGANTITVTCEDAAGNEGSASVSVTRTDVTGPTVIISSPANGSTTGLSPTLAYTASDDSGATPDCDLVNGSTLGPYAPGAQSVTVTCEDAANNVGSATSNFTAAVGDTTEPVVTITAPAASAVTNTTPTLTFTVNDNVDPSPDCDKTSGSTLGPLAGGANSVTVSCEDASGNVGSATRSFTVDAVAPVVTITSPANGSTVSVASPTLAFTVNDNIDGSPLCTRTTGAALGPFGNGAQSVTVSCTDDVGNSGSSTTNFTVQLPVDPPPSGGGPAPIAALSVLKPTIKGAVATIPVQTTVVGTLVATGTAKLPKGKKLKLQKAGSGSAAGGGSATINFKLSAPAKKYLAKKKKLAVTVTITYTPEGGSTITQIVKLNFKAAKKK